MANRTVEVKGRDTQLSYIDKKGSTIDLGHIRAEVYGEGEAQRFVYFPALGNPLVPDAKKEGEYALGVGSAHMNFVQPSEAQSLLLDRGYTIREQYASRGGLQISTQFIKEIDAIEDPFTHDKRFWSWRPKAEQDGKIYHAVQVGTDLRVGHMAATYTPGWYRTICTNGLFAAVLGARSVQVRHVDWDVDDLNDRLEKELMPTFDFGPVMTKGRFLKSARNLIRRYHKEIDDGKLSPEMAILEKQFHGVSRNSLYTWAIEGYLKQLDLLLDTLSDDDDVRGVHLVNAYTSAVNARRIRVSDRGTFSALESTNNVVNTTTALANLAAIFA